MKLSTLLAAAFIACLSISSTAKAAFPQDFSDVVFIESPSVKDWPVTSRLNVTIGGGYINMPYDKTNVWPRSSRLGGCCVASAWGFVKVGGIWHAGTWEYLRPGQITKKASAFGGCCHFRSPINNFNKVNGEIYGFMVTGVARDNLNGNNVRERTNVVLYRWGSGVVPFEEGTPGGGGTPEEEKVPNVGPAIDLLLTDGVSS